MKAVNAKFLARGYVFDTARSLLLAEWLRDDGYQDRLYRSRVGFYVTRTDPQEGWTVMFVASPDAARWFYHRATRKMALPHLLIPDGEEGPEPGGPFPEYTVRPWRLTMPPRGVVLASFADGRDGLQVLLHDGQEYWWAVWHAANWELYKPLRAPEAQEWYERFTKHVPCDRVPGLKWKE